MRHYKPCEGAVTWTGLLWCGTGHRAGAGHRSWSQQLKLIAGHRGTCCGPLFYAKPSVMALALRNELFPLFSHILRDLHLHRKPVQWVRIWYMDYRYGIWNRWFTSTEWANSTTFQSLEPALLSHRKTKVGWPTLNLFSSLLQRLPGDWRRNIYIYVPLNVHIISQE